MNLASVIPSTYSPVSALRMVSSVENPLKPEVFGQRSEGNKLTSVGPQISHTQYLDVEEWKENRT